MVRAGRDDGTDPHLLPRSPVAQCDVREKDRRLYLMSQRFALSFREFGTQVWNDRMITGQHAVTRLHAEGLTITHIGNQHPLSRFGVAVVLHLRDCAVEP